MRLLEIIPTPETERSAIDAVSQFADLHLGKGVVFAKDTPNFIGNRIGTFSVLNVIRLMQEMDLSIEEVDALTGDAVGWPKSATFRTIDLVGLDILGHVVGNMAKVRCAGGSPHAGELPDFYKQMLERKWLGDKTKGGFYKRTSGDGKEEERLALDWKTLEYHPVKKAKFPALDMAKNIEDPGARLRMLLGLEGARRKTIKPERFCGQRCPICGHTRPIAFLKFPTPLWRSIAPCAWASTGSSDRSSFGTRRESRPRSRE